jgi:hypothetical protein
VPLTFAESEIGVGVRAGVRLAVADGTRLAVRLAGRVRVRHTGRGLSAVEKVTSRVEFGESKSKAQPEKKKIPRCGASVPRR